MRVREKQAKDDREGGIICIHALRICLTLGVGTKKNNPLKINGLFLIIVGTVGLEPTTPAL